MSACPWPAGSVLSSLCSPSITSASDLAIDVSRGQLLGVEASPGVAEGEVGFPKRKEFSIPDEAESLQERVEQTFVLVVRVDVGKQNGPRQNTALDCFS